MRTHRAMNEMSYFGYRQVSREEKTRLVGGVFDAVAAQYDLMNDVISMGVHRLIRRWAVRASGVAAGDCVLDLAGGTADLTIRLSRIVGPKGRVVLADNNESMLAIGRQRLSRAGAIQNVTLVRTNAESLPFEEGAFGRVMTSFGLRNFTDKAAALRAAHGVLKPGGELTILEFSRPVNRCLRRAYYAYLLGLVPLAARVITGDSANYRYLGESIRMHPDQETLKQMMREAGFRQCSYRNVMGGIAALHQGTKPG
jgi:demethylmenaquinone methyltransferase/2-methoxy-6-polyprenyl-1,4-benzoquinol methylase